MGPALRYVAETDELLSLPSRGGHTSIRVRGELWVKSKCRT